MSCTKAIAALLSAVAWASQGALAADIDVKISGGLRAAYEKLRPGFEARTGHRLATVVGASAGASPNAIPVRLKRGEPTDVVIVTRESLDAMVKDGLIVPGSEVDLALSPIGAAVKQGAPPVDIATVEALRQAIAGAKVVAYYDNGSGDCLASCVMFRKLGIDPAAPKFVKSLTGPGPGALAAKGEADLVFNQLGELLPVPGIRVLGAVPEQVQSITVFAGGIATAARSAAQARALLEFLASREAAPAIEEAGLRPAVR